MAPGKPLRPLDCADPGVARMSGWWLMHNVAAIVCVARSRHNQVPGGTLRLLRIEKTSTSRLGRFVKTTPLPAVWEQLRSFDAPADAL